MERPVEARSTLAASPARVFLTAARFADRSPRPSRGARRSGPRRPVRQTARGSVLSCDHIQGHSRKDAMTTPRAAALVTGAAHRIGRAIASDLAAHGYDVAIHANRSAEAARALAAELADRHGVRTAVVIADLEDADAVARIVPAASEALGPLHVLVNNASVFEADDAASLDSALWRRQMAINAEAPARLVADFAASAAPDAGGRLAVNIVDQRVWKPTPRFLSYSASKATLWWLTRTMAQALAPHVRVNAIGPGPILKAARQSEEDFRAYADAMPLQRTPRLAEFGAAIRFLHGAESITGQMLAIDAGQHLSWQTPDALIDE